MKITDEFFVIYNNNFQFDFFNVSQEDVFNGRLVNKSVLICTAVNMYKNMLLYF